MRLNKFLSLILVFISFLCLTACKQNSTKLVGTYYYYIVDDTNELSVVVNYKLNKSGQISDNIDLSSLKMYYGFMESKSLDEITYYDYNTETDFTLQNNVLMITINFQDLYDEDNSYNQNIYFYTVYTNKDKETRYNYDYINIYEYAKSLTNKGELALSIIDKVENVYIDNIYISVDFDNLTYSCSDTRLLLYKVAFDSTAITLTISPLEKNVFFKQGCVIKVNNTVVKQKLEGDGSYIITVYKTELSDNLVSSLDLTLDLTKKQDKFENDVYTCTLENPKFETITITLTLLDTYIFDSNFELKLNGVSVDKTLYTIKDNTLTYVFSDPNWSPIY